MGRQRDTGFTLVEVLVATAVATVVLTAAGALLGVSARAVSDSELETTATWLTSRIVEEWRSAAAMALMLEGQRVFDRDGQEVSDRGLFVVRWSARAEPGPGALWRITASATSPRMRDAATMTVVVAGARP